MLPISSTLTLKDSKVVRNVSNLYHPEMKQYPKTSQEKPINNSQLLDKEINSTHENETYVLTTQQEHLFQIHCYPQTP
jgi:hypothetical protein